MTELTDTEIKAARPKEKPYKLRDGAGLFLLVTPMGGRLWRLRFGHGKSERMLSLGAYPDVSLKAARKKRDEARTQIAKGVDLSARRRAEKASRADTLSAVAGEFFEREARRLSPATLTRDKQQLAKILPTLGNRPIAGIAAPDLLAGLRRIESRGRVDSAHRTKQVFSRIARYAIATGRCERDVAADLRGALATPVVVNYAAITDPVKVGGLLRAIDGYSGQATTYGALRLLPLLLARPGEVRGMRWDELTLQGSDPMWRIPAERMKMDREHLVPLASQALSIICEMQPVSGHCEIVFPSLRSGSRPISNNTLNAALRRLGYSSDDQTAHGFRSTASTLLNEQGYPPDVIELQLAHQDQSVRAIYNRSLRLDERRKMLQAWADYLDGLRAGASNVVPIRRQA